MVDYESMEYRNLGPSGVKVSVLGLGNFTSTIYQSVESEEEHF